VTLRQDARNVGTQVRTHRTQGTQKIRRLRQDATADGSDAGSVFADAVAMMGEERWVGESDDDFP